MEIGGILFFVFLSAFFLVIGLTPARKVDIKGLYEDAADTEVRTGLMLALTPLTKKLELINRKLKSLQLARYREYLKKRLWRMMLSELKISIERMVLPI